MYRPPPPAGSGGHFHAADILMTAASQLLAAAFLLCRVLRAAVVLEMPPQAPGMTCCIFPRPPPTGDPRGPAQPAICHLPDPEGRCVSCVHAQPFSRCHARPLVVPPGGHHTRPSPPSAHVTADQSARVFQHSGTQRGMQAGKQAHAGGRAGGRAGGLSSRGAVLKNTDWVRGGPGATRRGCQALRGGLAVQVESNH